jgi:hypothetical protein
VEVKINLSKQGQNLAKTDDENHSNQKKTPMNKIIIPRITTTIKAMIRITITPIRNQELQEDDHVASLTKIIIYKTRVKPNRVITIKHHHHYHSSNNNNNNNSGQELLDQEYIVVVLEEAIVVDLATAAMVISMVNFI